MLNVIRSRLHYISDDGEKREIITIEMTNNDAADNLQ